MPFKLCEFILSMSRRSCDLMSISNERSFSIQFYLYPEFLAEDFLLMCLELRRFVAKANRRQIGSIGQYLHMYMYVKSSHISFCLINFDSHRHHKSLYNRNMETWTLSITILQKYWEYLKIFNASVFNLYLYDPILSRYFMEPTWNNSDHTLKSF